MGNLTEHEHAMLIKNSLAIEEELELLREARNATKAKEANPS